MQRSHKSKAYRPPHWPAEVWKTLSIARQQQEETKFLKEWMRDEGARKQEAHESAVKSGYVPGSSSSSGLVRGSAAASPLTPAEALRTMCRRCDRKFANRTNLMNHLRFHCEKGLIPEKPAMTATVVQSLRDRLGGVSPGNANGDETIVTPEPDLETQLLIDKALGCLEAALDNTPSGSAAVPAAPAPTSRDGDYWEVRDNVLVRVHRVPRRTLFSPWGVDEMPRKVVLGSARVTVARYEGDHAEEVIEDYTDVTFPNRMLSRPWIGEASFAIIPGAGDGAPAMPCISSTLPTQSLIDEAMRSAAANGHR